MESAQCCFILRGSRFFLFFSAAVLALGLFSCGGGGGSDSDGKLGTPAAIDDSNAVALTANAYASQDIVPRLGDLSSAMANPSASVGVNDLCLLTQKLVARIENYNPPADAPSPNPSSALVSYDPDPVPGEFGGTMTVSLTVDSGTGDFSGTLAFNDFSDEQGTTESGAVTVTGNMNIISHRILSMTMRFDAFSTENEEGSFALNGESAISCSGDDFALTLNVSASEDGRTIRFEHFTITCTTGVEYLTLAINGRFSTSEYGYVDLTTTEDFTMGLYDDYPSSGVLIAVGAEGSAGGNTSARLEVMSSTTYEVTADTDGDGAYDDWDSGEQAWD